MGSKPYPISGRHQMSFSRWSRHEPVMFTKTDHWTKQRAKAYKLTQLPTGETTCFYAPHEVATVRRLGIPKSTGLTRHGTLAPVGDERFSHYLQNELHTGSIVKPYVPADSRGYNKKVRLPSASSQRAKRGYVYWCKKPKPTTHGQKVTFGS